MTEEERDAYNLKQREWLAAQKKHPAKKAALMNRHKVNKQRKGWVQSRYLTPNLLTTRKFANNHWDYSKGEPKHDPNA